MQLHGIISGSAPLIKKYQISADSLTPGVPKLIPAAGGAGVAVATTTSCTDFVGVTIDVAASYQTAQQSDNSDPARTVSLIVNPDAIWEALMSGGATENTALALQTITTASTSGLVLTTAAEWSSPTYDEGYAWGYEGANAGKARKITSVSSTAGTLTVAMPVDTAVGDTFLRCPYSPLQGVNIQLTTLLTQADASIAVGTGAELKPIELILKDITDNGRTNSYVRFLAIDHVFGGRPT